MVCDAAAASQVVGVLKGCDALLNLVLDESQEYLKARDRPPRFAVFLLAPSMVLQVWLRGASHMLCRTLRILTSSSTRQDPWD